MPRMTDLKHDRSVCFAKIQDDDGKRVVTIAYRIFPHRTRWNVEYAASIFRKDREKEVYSRKKHVQTARGRLAVRPRYTTFDLDKETLDVLSQKRVLQTKEERRAYALSADGEHWKRVRKNLYQNLAMFLRKEIYKHGVRGDRLKHSELERRRRQQTEDPDVNEVAMLLSGLNHNDRTDHAALEKAIELGIVRKS